MQNKLTSKRELKFLTNFMRSTSKHSVLLDILYRDWDKRKGYYTYSVLEYIDIEELPNLGELTDVYVQLFKDGGSIWLPKFEYKYSNKNLEYENYLVLSIYFNEDYSDYEIKSKNYTEDEWGDLPKKD